MSGLLISFLTLVLILISVFVILLVLMQRTSQSGGMGAALGGGAAESAFGSDTTNVLTKSTIYGTIAFFVVALGLFLIYQSKVAERSRVLDPVELISTDTDPLTEANLIEGDLQSSMVEIEADSDEASMPVIEAENSIETEIPAGATEQ